MRKLFFDRWFLAAMLLFTGLIVGLQIYGGAYEAEFTGHPDEAAHFVSSLLVRDYIGLWPPVDPMPWAVQYYIHYPKVAIGQWPPGYYVIQALWWVLFPAGRSSALWLNVGMSVSAMALFYGLARRIRPGWPILYTGTLLLLTPVMQEANAMVMSDVSSLLAGLSVMYFLTRLLEEPRAKYLLYLAAALAAALVIKGTGAALLGAPVFALVASGAWRGLRVGRVVSILAATGIPMAAIYLLQYRGSWHAILSWSGVTFQMFWSVGQVPRLAGVVCLAVAAIGAAVALRARSTRLAGPGSWAAVCAASVFASFLVISYFLRAIREPRHWIVLIPALLLLVLALYAWLEERWPRLALLALFPLLVTYPFSIYRQTQQGFRAVAAQLRLPARMLVSSAMGWSEGPWIAVVAAGEARPGSTIVRATKLLADTDWNGTRYNALVHNGEEMERTLDENGIDIVVLHQATVRNGMPHHQLLREFVQTSSAWRPCAQAGNVEAFCRTQPPKLPGKPLRIRLRSRLGYDIEER